MTLLTAWDQWALLWKWLGLLSMAGMVGGGFALLLAQGLRLPVPAALTRYVRTAAGVGLLAAPAFLLTQVGAINQAGLAGLFDLALTQILLQSSLGHALQLRVLACVVVLVLPGLQPTVVCEPQRRLGTPLGFLVVLGLSGISFGLSGHVSALAVSARILVGLHALTVFLWTGALYPLLLLSRSADLRQTQRLMRSFGMLALGIVAVLTVAGSTLLVLLLDSPAALWRSDYGRSVVVKLCGVCALLLLAGLNKLVLVPRLTTTAALVKLQTSIKVELVVALLTLLATAWLTTLTGPLD